MSVTFIPPAPWTGRQDPEDGPAARRFYHLIADNAPRAIIGFACEAGVARNKGRVGTKAAPDIIRKALAGLAVPTDAAPVRDAGTFTVDGDDLEAGQDKLADTLKDIVGEDHRTLVLGGGHETAYGSFMGLHRAFPDKKIGIINFDAHLDLRVPGEAGPSSGTPFTQIRNLRPDAFDYLCIGAARESNTQALFDRAKGWGVKVVYDTDLNHDLRAADTEIDAMIARNDLIYLTIDMDVLPASQVPGVSAPAVRGVPFTTIEYLTDRILTGCADTNTPLPLADIVEINPTYDQDGISAKTAAFLARKILIAP